MKHLTSTRVVCVALVATIGLLALAGAGSASATTLCKENKETCPESQRYATGSVFKLALKEGTTLKFASTLPLECEASAIVDVLLEGTNPLYDEVTSWTATKCSSSGAECTVTTDTTPWTSEIEYSLNPTIVLRDKIEGKKPEAEEKCSVATCRYSAEKIVLDFKGGQPAEVIANEEPLVRQAGGILCGATAKMTGIYVIKEVESGGKTVKTPPVFVTK
jgi:hypothetical protein